MKPKYFFENDKISYPEYLKTIEAMLEHKTFIGYKPCIENGIAALEKIDNDNKRKRLISNSVFIDRVFSQAGTTNRNCGKKLPIIMKVADLIANDYDKIKDLSNEELSLVGYFLSPYEIPSTDKRFSLFIDKELLQAIQQKDADYNHQFEMLWAIDMKLDEFDIDNKTDEEFNNIKNEIISTVKNSTKEEIMGMVNFEERVTEEMIKSGI